VRDSKMASPITLAVATTEPQASAVADEIWKAGGTLADVVVATSFAISVVRPQATGIAGGGFLLYWNAKSKTSEAWDFREVAPKLTKAMYFINEEGRPDPRITQTGAKAVAVPGLVAGLWRFHRTHGKLPWGRLLEPAIRIAELGTTVSEHMAKALREDRERLIADPEMTKIFYPAGQPLQEGDILLQPELGATLRAIAKNGKNEFYELGFAQKLTKWMKQQKGLIQASDLKTYEVKRRKALRGTYRNFEILSFPPPSSGGIHLLQLLEMVERVDPKKWGETELYAHRDSAGRSLQQVAIDIEAFKRAYADRAKHLGDPDFYPVPIQALLKKEYLAKRAREIESNQKIPAEQVLPWSKEYDGKKQTTHMSFLDADGNAVATTQTINGIFGAGVVLPGTGVVLNNEMDDFSIAPGVANLYGLVGSKANQLEPSKRPLSSMTPTIVLDRPTQKTRLVAGSRGGSRIITQVYEVVSQILRDGVSPEAAVAACRYHHQWSPDEVFIEPGCEDDFEPLGNRYKLSSKGGFGEVEVVGRLLGSDDLFSTTDPRGRGIPMLTHR